MHRFCRAAIALSALLGLSAGILAVASAATAPQEPVPQASLCEPFVWRTAFPSEMLLGETTSIALSFNLVCPSVSSPLHLVLVLDGSAAMAGGPEKQLRQTAERIIQYLELPDNPTALVGIVDFNSRARTLCRLGNDEADLLRCVNKVGAYGGSAIDRGITEGLKVITAGRRGLSPWVQPSEVMILISDGANDRGCDVVKAASSRVMRDGVLMITICASRSCDEACLNEVASSPRYFFRAEDVYWMFSVFDTIRDADHFWSVIAPLSLTDTIPANMEIIESSVAPPARISTDGRSITLVLRKLQGNEAVRLSYKLRPLEAGHHPTGVKTTAAFVDQVGGRGSVVVPGTGAAVTVFAALGGRQHPSIP